MDALLGFASFLAENARPLTGFAVPIIVEILNKEADDEQEKFWVSVITCIVVAILIHLEPLLSGTMTAEQFAIWFGLIFSESQATYHLYFKYSEPRRVIQRIIGKRVDEDTQVSLEQPIEETKEEKNTDAS